MAQIHPTAIVAARASLAPDVVIGPFCIVGEHVALGAGVTLRKLGDGTLTIARDLGRLGIQNSARDAVPWEARHPRALKLF